VKFFIPTEVDNPAPVRELGSTVPVSAYRMKLRDDARCVVQFFSGSQGGATPVRPYLDLDLVFALKKPGLLPWDSVVLGTNFDWDADSLSYIGRPSFGTLQLLGMFVGAVDVKEVTSSYTVQSTDKSQLIGATHASVAIVLTLPDLGNVGDRWDIVRGGTAGVSISAGVGVTITVADGVNAAALVKARIVRLTKTAVGAYTLALAPEVDSVTTVGEFSWRSLASPEDWESSGTFSVVIDADVYRGFEGAPDNLASASNYLTIVSATALLAAKANVVDVDAAIDVVSDALSAHVGNTTNPHAVTKTQVGLGNVDNTTDLNKPISTATQTALDTKQANLADVVTAAAYTFPASVTVNAKGLITAITPARRAYLTDFVSTTTSTVISVGPSLTISGSFAVGDVFEIYMAGSTSNGTTASTFRLNVYLGSSPVTGLEFAMGTTAATRAWTFRAVVSVASISSGNPVFRVTQHATRNSSATASVSLVAAEQLASMAAPATISARCGVTVATATSFIINEGYIRQV
jgi:hypothetical protein